jgi:hypothetical protein
MFNKLKDIISKMKLLIKVREPITTLFTQVKEAKRGYRTMAFWVSVLGTLISLVGALNGVIPPQIAIIITTILTAIYNIIRGTEKSEETGVRPLLKSTEFWQGALGEISNSIVQMQTAGVNPEWFHMATGIIGMSMAIAQNLGAHQPVASAPK